MVDAIQRAYENLIIRVVEETFEDLVDGLVTELEHRKKARTAPTAVMRDDQNKLADEAGKKAAYWQSWLEEVAPRYLEIDGKRYRQWADAEVREYERTGVKRYKRHAAANDALI